MVKKDYDLSISIFYYKTDNPEVIISSGLIKLSKVYGTISLTTNPYLKSHGKYRIAFKANAFAGKVRPISYFKPIFNEPPRVGCKALYYEDQFGNKVTKEEYNDIPYPKYASIKSKYIKHNPDFIDEQEWVGFEDLTFSPKDVLNITSLELKS